MARRSRAAARTPDKRSLAERLAAAKAPNATVLDLTSLSLTELPSELLELFKLPHLRRLGLSGNALTHIPDAIAGLAGLQVLDLRGNPLEAIPTGVFELTELRQLDLAATRISTIPDDIARLRRLESLDLSLAPIVTVSDRIGSLDQLQDFVLHSAKLSTFPDALLDCISLRNLVLYENSNLFHSSFGRAPRTLGRWLVRPMSPDELVNVGIVSLPDVFDRFPELTSLFLDGNQITTLPPSMRALSKLTELGLEGNKLPIPPEILKATPQQILNYYFSTVEGGAKVSLNEAKMVVVGQGGVGKTSLVRRLLGQDIDAHETTTRGIRILPWHDGEGADRLTVNIWDFGGQEIMHATHQFFLTKRTLYVLVLDSRQGEQESRLEYWLKIIQSFGGASPVIVVCNKSDEHILSLDENGLRPANTTRSHISLRRVSCAGAGEGIDDLRQTLLREIRRLDHLHDQFLTSWIAVKHALEAMEDDYISFGEYETLCREHGVTDPVSQRTLVAFLHDLGVVLNFADDPRLIETSILNPGWVTAGVYQILNAHLDGGVLPLSRLSDILDTDKYPQRQHLFITGMMKKFELCFEFDDPPNTFLLPDLLPKNEPDTGSWDEALRFEYHYEVLPSSVISRFIVRMHPFISHRTYWRSGVVIAKDGCRALIKADLEDRKIFVHVSGGGARRMLMDVIRSQFELIHATIPELVVQEKVPMPDNPDVVADYRNLVTMLELGETTFVPVGAKQRYEIRPLLDGIETVQRREAKQGERSGYAARRSPSSAMAPKDIDKVAWWQIGLFLLFTVVVIVCSFGGVAWLVGGSSLAIVVIGTVLVLCFIGVLIALHTGRLTERNAVTVIRDVLSRLRMVQAAKPG